MSYNGKDVHLFKSGQAVSASNRLPVDASVTTGGLLVDVEYDSIAVAYPTALVEEYTYFTGGLAGTLVATITVTYVAADKEELVSVVRT
jgi:hypothetical protein